MQPDTRSLEDALRQAARQLDFRPGLERRGVVAQVSDGVAWVRGLEGVGYEELVRFDRAGFGMALDLGPRLTGVVLLSQASSVREGDGVRGQARLPDLPVGPATLGRVLDPMGRPIDEGPPLNAAARLPLFRPAPEIIERKAVDQGLWTGVMAIDAAIPIGRGQRELIIGDRNVGKTALALDIVAAQRGGEVRCVYVVIGQPMSRVLAIRDTLERTGSLEHTVMIAADAAESPGLQYLAPYAGASLAESFRDAGGHALVVFDDLTKHADAYRELALLLNRPPGREAYPGDIFHIHAELLERAAPRPTHLGGGSVTAFPIVETTEGDISSYIPTNLISITDGQIYLDTARFERNERPAIDVGRSVSRIGSQVQAPPLREVARKLRIQLSRYESLESLTRVGLDMDLAMRSVLRRGSRIREALRQSRFSARGLPHQVLTLWLTQQDWPERLPVESTVAIVDRWLDFVRLQQPALWQRLADQQLPDAGWQQDLAQLAEAFWNELPQEPPGAAGQQPPGAAETGSSDEGAGTAAVRTGDGP